MSLPGWAARAIRAERLKLVDKYELGMVQALNELRDACTCGGLAFDHAAEVYIASIGRGVPDPVLRRMIRKRARALVARTLN